MKTYTVNQAFDIFNQAVKVMVNDTEWDHFNTNVEVVPEEFVRFTVQVWMGEMLSSANEIVLTNEFITSLIVPEIVDGDQIEFLGEARFAEFTEPEWEVVLGEDAAIESIDSFIEQEWFARYCFTITFVMA